MSTSGKRLLCSLVTVGSISTLLELQLSAPLFREGPERDLFEFISEHIDQHGVIPKPDTVMEKLGEDAIVEAPEPPSYYMGEVEKRYKQTMLKKAVMDASTALKEENPDAALEIVSVVADELQRLAIRQQLFDFRDASDLIYKSYIKAHVQEDSYGTFFGWPTLDEMSAGMQPGDFVTINGRPAMGKTFLLLYAAMHSWRVQKMAPLFISMEMNATIIQQRLTSMQSHKPLTHLLKGTLSTASLKHILGVLNANVDYEVPFWVIDGNLTSTAADIVKYVRMLKPGSVWVDGGYLLQHPNARMGKFERIGENAEMLKKRVAGDCKIGVCASYQLNRESTKKTKKEKHGVEDIYGNDAMGQLSTIALGLFQEDSVETKHRRHVDVMKGRNGETGGFDINWDFVGMDFSEAKDAIVVDDMTFMS